MTKQCRFVVDSCGFDVVDSHEIEQLMCKNTPGQVVDLVKRKDPDGIQSSIKWFLPFFNGYVKPVVNVVCGSGNLFWSTYDIVCQFVEDFDVSHLPLVLDMSMDTERMKRSMSRSKPNIVYLHKVWSSLSAVESPQVFNKIEGDIERHTVSKIKFD